MSKQSKRASWKHRPLLTETLPYELPVIFGNERFYQGRCRDPDDDLVPLLKRLMQPSKLATIPYNYSIQKDDRRTTELSVIHPLVQIDFCELYDKYENTLLDHCSRSPFSLRYPAAVAAVYSNDVHQEQVVHKTGEIDLLPGDFDLELSKLVSYFSYDRYTLLNKFYDSKEFLRLEKRFELLRQLDVSKCFYGIYTHTISWATRSKTSAKENANSYHFEGYFDTLMQRCNYGETNGIVVGPEFSRIFAEIILQGIDREVAKRLRRISNLVEGRDYSVRRYVDDYAIFASSIDTLSVVERELRTELAKFKLYVNEAKVRDYQRPFVSQLSHARVDLRRILAAVKGMLSEDEWKSEQDLNPIAKGHLDALISSVRMSVHGHGVEFAHVSGGLMADLRAIVRQATAHMDGAGAVWKRKWATVISRILECAFYVCALDLRVRTTYSLCQLLLMASGSKGRVSRSVWQIIERIILEELVGLARVAHQLATRRSRIDSVELYNILICGSHIVGIPFLRTTDIKGIIEAMLSESLTYFKYTCLKYCLLLDKENMLAHLEALNQKAERVDFTPESIARDSEKFHLFCDLLGAPDLSAARKRALYVKVFGGNPSAALVAKLGSWVGFTDWSGMSIEHTLRRRQMRPVYAVA